MHSQTLSQKESEEVKKKRKLLYIVDENINYLSHCETEYKDSSGKKNEGRAAI